MTEIHPIHDKGIDNEALRFMRERKAQVVELGLSQEMTFENYLVLDKPNQIPDNEPSDNDQANLRAIDSPTSQELEYELRRLQIAGVLQLDIPLVLGEQEPKFLLAVNSNGEPFALVWNVGCVVPEMVQDNLLGDRVKIRIPFGQRFLGRQPKLDIYYWPVQGSFYFEKASALTEIREVPIDLGGDDFTLPLISLRSAVYGERKIECPSVTQRFASGARNLLGDFGNRLSDIDLNQVSELAGRALGELVSEFTEGFEEGRRGSDN